MASAAKMSTRAVVVAVMGATACSSENGGSPVQHTLAGTSAYETCCLSTLVTATVGPGAFGSWIVVQGSDVPLGLVGDTYWLGICSDGSGACRTGTWLWSATATLSCGSDGGSCQAGDPGYLAPLAPFVANQCPASWGSLWGANLNQMSYGALNPSFVQCGINLTGGTCGMGSYCIDGCCVANDACTGVEYNGFEPPSYAGYPDLVGACYY
jgi:hypothetical protein